MIKKIVMCEGKTFYYSGGDFHTSFGMISSEDMKKNVAETNTGKKCFILNPSFVDKVQKITRGPQAMMEKDIASIINYISPSQSSKIVEVGAGSGKMTCFLRHFFPNASIVSYDKNQDNLNLVKKNLEFLGVDSVMLKHQDVLESFEDKEIDAVIIDIPDADKALDNISPGVKNGGHVVAYLPSIVQVQSFVEKCESNNIIVDSVLENLQREWHVEGRKVRPKSPGILHTAFLIFARKV